MNGADDAAPVADRPPPSVARVALHGLCPRCGARALFAGIVRFADRCRCCGLNYAAFNVDDGPAAILTLVIGAIVAGLAITVELAWSPPVWVHILLWPPIALALILLSLRACKAALLALEYRTAAHEGRIARP